MPAKRGFRMTKFVHRKSASQVKRNTRKVNMIMRGIEFKHKGISKANGASVTPFEVTPITNMFQGNLWGQRDG